MTTEATLCHDGCNACLSVTAEITKLMDPSCVALYVSRLEVEPMHTAEAEGRAVHPQSSLAQDVQLHGISPCVAIVEFIEVAPET